MSVGTSAASARIAELLGIEPGVELVSRRRLVRQDNGDPSEIVTWWLSLGLAEQTGLGGPEPVRGGVRSLLDRNAGLRIDHVVEQVTARRAEPDEAKLLGISRSAPVLALYVSAREASGRPVLALAVVMAGDLHELEDAYPIG